MKEYKVSIQSLINHIKTAADVDPWAKEMTEELLKDLEAKPPIHVHEEYPKHDWKIYEDGNIDEFAWGHEYCNGPMCKRCHYTFCIHCEPNGYDKKPCIIDFYKCPGCGERISKNTKFCSNCGQEVKWE